MIPRSTTSILKYIPACWIIVPNPVAAPVSSAATNVVNADASPKRIPVKIYGTAAGTTT